VILDDAPLTETGVAGDATLDDLFRGTAARRPDAIALIDPPNRASFTDGRARHLTYAQADRAISALTGRLRQMNLPTDAVVGLQMANTVDSVLAFMAVLRAELIAMPLPLLWRRSDTTGAIRRSGASALIVSGRIGATDHFDLAVNAAAEAFTVRHVGGFGLHPPDGVISLDDVYADTCPSAARASASERVASPRSAHLAAITWDVAVDGAVAVARSDAQLIAGGLAVMLESRMPQNAVILSTIPLSSFGGIAVTLVPWLLAGGTLALHHPFDCATFAQQCRELHGAAVVVPGPLVSGAGSGRISGRSRQPQERGRRVARAGAIAPGAGVARARQPVDRRAALRRDRPGGGAARAHRQAGTDSARTAAGAAGRRQRAGARRGRHIGDRNARAALVSMFLPGVERTSLPRFAAGADGFVDTGYACEGGRAPGTLVVSGAPAGLVSFGGYRFAIRELADVVSGLDPTGTLAARPDVLAGQRLAGAAANHEAIRMALRGIGANPLLVEAFGSRPRPGPERPPA
jgi:hypothetical protein